MLRRRTIPNGIRLVGATLASQQPESLNSDTQEPYVGLPAHATPSHKISIAVAFCNPSMSLADNRSLRDIGDNEQITFDYIPDPSRDMFQIGRLDSNDFVVRGPLHNDESAFMPTGPVSRFACRIECERFPPFRCFLIAAGFNEKKVRKPCSRMRLCVHMNKMTCSNCV